MPENNTMNHETVHRCSQATIATVVLAVLAGTAMSQPLPEHAVRFTAESGTCAVSFVPDATTGEVPPELEVSVNMLSDRLSLQVIGGTYSEQVFLWGDTRTTVPPLRNVEAEALLQDAIWQAMVDAAAENAPIYWTVQEPGGGYSSARYDVLSPVQIARTMALACDFDGLNPSTPTEVEAQRAERRLDLTEEQIRHVRRVLFGLYGEPGAEPGTGAELTVTDRRLIGLYNQENGMDYGEYLTPTATAALLELEPELQMALPASDIPASATHQDWLVFSEESGAVCSMMTSAKSTTGYTGSVLPVMRFSVARSASGGLMAIELTRPNSFEPDTPVRALIDGNPIALMMEPSSGALVPRPLADGRLSNEFTVRMRQGSEIVIEGNSIDTGGPMRLGFSAAGFTAAFREMAELCNRPAVLGWIR